MADSYALWWHEAGLHSATASYSHGWLAEPAAESARAQPRQRLTDPAPAVPVRSAVSPAMPGDLAGFRNWLEQDQNQPEVAWSGPLFLPPMAEKVRLLVLIDMPDDKPVGPVMPLAGPAARFLAAMLGAIGLADGEVALAPLAMRSPPGGLLDAATLGTLADRMRHYLGLARPRAALILGDRTSRALIAAHGGTAAGNLPAVNHAGGTMPVAALAGPDLLMKRPLAKAASWQTLRLLRSKIGN